VSVIIKPAMMEQNYRTLPRWFAIWQANPRYKSISSRTAAKRGNPHWIKDLASLRAVLDELIALHREGYPIVGR